MSRLTMRPVPFCRSGFSLILALALSLASGLAQSADLSESARSRLLLDKNDPPPKVTPGIWDRAEDYSSPAELADEVPKAMFDLLGFMPRRLSPLPPVTPRIQGMSQNLVKPGMAPPGLSFARRVTEDGMCRVFVAKETALALDDTTFVQWHERAHCDRGYNDRELEESKANIQGFLMMAKTGDVWYAWQSIDNRARTLDKPEPFWVPYKLGYRVGLGTLLPLFKKRGGPKKEFGFDVVEILKTMSERQVNALAMLLVEDARNKVGDLYGGQKIDARAIPVIPGAGQKPTQPKSGETESKGPEEFEPAYGKPAAPQSRYGRNPLNDPKVLAPGRY